MKRLLLYSLALCTAQLCAEELQFLNKLDVPIQYIVGTKENPPLLSGKMTYINPGKESKAQVPANPWLLIYEEGKPENSFVYQFNTAGKSKIAIKIVASGNGSAIELQKMIGMNIPGNITSIDIIPIGAGSSIGATPKPIIPSTPIASAAPKSAAPTTDANKQLLQAVDAANVTLAVADALAKGADVNAQDSNGETILIKIIKSNLDDADKKHIIGRLLSNKANVNIEDKKLQTALIYAIATNNKDITALILNATPKPNVDFISTTGSTPLMLAANKGYKDQVALLLAHGADATIENGSWKTALDYAKDAEVKKLISDAQAKQKK